MLRFTMISACVLAGCYSYPGDVATDATPGIDAGADADVDAVTDAPSVDTPAGQWSAPEALLLNDPNAFENGPSVSPNGLELYFGAPQSVGNFVSDVFYVTRTSTSLDWGAGRTAVGPVNSSAASEGSVSISADGLEMHLNRGGEIYASRRATTGAAWGTPTPTGLMGGSPDILADGLVMYYRATGASCPVDLCRMKVTRATTSSPWGSPTLESINDGGTYQTVDISGDGLRALLSGPMSSSVAKVAIASRPTRSAPWGIATPVTELSVYTAIIAAAWSWDEREMYLTYFTGSQDLYISHLR